MSPARIQRFVALLALALPSMTAVQTEAGARTSIRPDHRQHHAVAYDPAARRVVLHGGLTRDRGGIDAPARDDLWSWDGQSWRLISQHSGVARVGHLLFADGSGGIFVSGGEPQGTTERWDSRRWVTLADDVPLRRSFAAGAYDARRKRFVVFGGRLNAENKTAGDTWEFDGQRWSEVVAAGPPPMLGAAMAYDERRGVVVLFGGRNGPSFFGDTWTWDGARWQRVATTGPSPRFEPGMAYDARRGEVILFGGYHPAGRHGDTWIWDGSAWRQVDISGPSPRNEGFAAYDASRAMTVLFGGCCSGPAGGALGDLWEWDGKRWAEIK